MSRALLLALVLVVFVLGVGYLVYRISDRQAERKHERRMTREERDYEQLMTQLEHEMEQERTDDTNDRKR